MDKIEPVKNLKSSPEIGDMKNTIFGLVWAPGFEKSHKIESEQDGFFWTVKIDNNPVFVLESKIDPPYLFGGEQKARSLRNLVGMDVDLEMTDTMLAAASFK